MSNEEKILKVLLQVDVENGSEERKARESLKRIAERYAKNRPAYSVIKLEDGRFVGYVKEEYRKYENSLRKLVLEFAKEAEDYLESFIFGSSMNIANYIVKKYPDLEEECLELIKRLGEEYDTRVIKQAIMHLLKGNSVDQFFKTAIEVRQMLLYRVAVDYAYIDDNGVLIVPGFESSSDAKKKNVA